MPKSIIWTAELENSIIQWIADGKTLREFCRQDGMPSHDAVYDHEKLDDDFKQRIACARTIGEDVIAQECLEIADNGTNDWVETKFGPQVNPEHIQRSRLRVDTRLKLLSKWNPRKYGERLQSEHSGPDGGPIQIKVDREALIAKLLDNRSAAPEE